MSGWYAMIIESAAKLEYARKGYLLNIGPIKKKFMTQGLRVNENTI